MERDIAPHRGTLIFTLGILGLLCCCLFLGLPAWLMGRADLEKIRQGLLDPAGEELTRAGVICGIIGTLLSVVFLLGTMVFTVVLIAGMA